MAPCLIFPDNVFRDARAQASLIQGLCMKMVPLLVGQLPKLMCLRPRYVRMPLLMLSSF